MRGAFQFSDRIWSGLSDDLIQAVKSYQNKIETKNKTAVSVHIRRGDYLDNNEVYGGICTEEYYKKAIAVMKEKFADALFFVFSNEPEWVKEWLNCTYKGEDRFVVIEGTDEDTGYLDMFLMSRCKHHIIANSSFSWWGAWLNPDKNKKLIAPAKWFNNQNMRDIYTKEMIRISPKGEVGQEAAEI